MKKIAEFYKSCLTLDRCDIRNKLADVIQKKLEELRITVLPNFVRERISNTSLGVKVLVNEISLRCEISLRENSVLDEISLLDCLTELATLDGYSKIEDVEILSKNKLICTITSSSENIHKKEKYATLLFVDWEHFYRISMERVYCKFIQNPNFYVKPNMDVFDHYGPKISFSFTSNEKIDTNMLGEYYDLMLPNFLDEIPTVALQKERVNDITSYKHTFVLNFVEYDDIQK